MKAGKGSNKRRVLLLGAREDATLAKKLASALAERRGALRFAPNAGEPPPNQALWSLIEDVDLVAIDFHAALRDDVVAMSLLGIAGELRKPIVVLAFNDAPDPAFLALLQDRSVSTVKTMDDALGHIIGPRRKSVGVIGLVVVGAVLSSVLGLAGWLLFNQHTISADRRDCLAAAGPELSIAAAPAGVAFGFVSPADAALCARAVAREGDDGTLRFAYARALRAGDNPAWRRQMLEAARRGDVEAALLAHYPSIGGRISVGDQSALRAEDQEELDRLSKGSILTLADAARRGSPAAAVLLARYADVVSLMLEEERREFGDRGALHAGLGLNAPTPGRDRDLLALHPPHVMRWLGQASAANFPPALYEAAALDPTAFALLAPYDPRSAVAILDAALAAGYGPALHAQGARLIVAEATRAQGIVLLRQAVTAGYRPAMITLARVLVASGDTNSVREARAIMDTFTRDFEATSP